MERVEAELANLAGKQAVHSLAEADLAAGRHRQAHGRLIAALEADQHDAEAWFLLGVLTAEHGNFARALGLFDRAVAASPGHPRAHAHRARVLVALNRPDAAREAAVTAEQLARPGDAHTLDTIGVALARTGLHDRAAALFRKASALGPDRPDYAYNLAAALQFLGNFDEADEAYRRVLVLDPGFYKAASARAGLRRQTVADNAIPELEALFGAAGGDADQALHVGHALAKTHEDLGDWPAALDWLLRAKAAKAAELAYDGKADAALFRQALAPPPPVTGTSGEAPIFIVGLPRTGTTLADRILSSHRDVRSAGELTYFGLILKRMAGTASNLVLDAETLGAAARVDLDRLGRDYVVSARALVGAEGRFIDKMPLNVFYAGVIHAALPQARIICLRRHPADACLSNFRQLFATSFSYYNYAYDLGDLARYYAGFDRMAAHWRETLPADRYTELWYEDLVADQEGETRRLLAFCGLDWDEACLAFHENTAPVATASSVQVRSPLYATSIGRWRRYGDRLEPLVAALRAEGVMVEG